MDFEIQKAGTWKRAAACMIDGAILTVLTVVFALLLFRAVHFDDYGEQVQAAYAKYEDAYGVSFEITQAEYEAMTQEELDRYNQAYEALIADQEAMYAYNMNIYLTLLIAIASILLSCVLLELVGPLFLGNGQTLGKRFLGLAVTGTDGIQITKTQLFVRTLLGKYTVEIMIPVLLLLLYLLGIIGLMGIIIPGLLVLLQVILFGTSRTNLTIHDRMARTVVIDTGTQRIFKDRAEMLQYQEKLAAEEKENAPSSRKC